MKSKLSFKKLPGNIANLIGDQQISRISMYYFIKYCDTKNLRRVFGPKMDKNGEWRKLQNKELHSLYCLPNIVMVMKCRRL